MEIGKEAVDKFYAGHDTVGTTVKAAGPDFKAAKYIRIKADLANGDDIYVRPYAGTGEDGIVLDAGEWIDIQVDSLDKVFVIGGAASQGYSWLVV
jgi:hypothetical protein